ncbi:MAG: SCP2 sterol-binding domain-containing protein [Pseudomonadota bacterium]
MSELINNAVEALSAKITGSFDSSAKFVIEDEGSIVIDGDGVRAADDETEVTLTADADTFQAILSGDMDPAAAFMSGNLAVSGDMGIAMKLGGLLS